MEFCVESILELWDGRQQYSDFKRRIDGVEAFSPYITPLHNYVYDNLYVEDMRELVAKLDYSYDLVLLMTSWNTSVRQMENFCWRSYYQKI